MGHGCQTLAEQPPWLARVRCGDEVTGAGTLVDDSHVIAFGLEVGRQLVVEFPVSESGARSAVVISRDRSTDICVLCLSSPVTLTSAPLFSRRSVSDHRFWARCFPCEQPAVDLVHGTLGGRGGPSAEWILADFDTRSRQVFSAPRCSTARWKRLWASSAKGTSCPRRT